MVNLKSGKKNLKYLDYLRHFEREKIVGDFLAFLVKETGEIANVPLHDYIKGIDTKSIQNIANTKKVIGVAGGTKQLTTDLAYNKVETIHAVLKAGLVNVLITDEWTAEELLATA